jgi:hypothetical protein
MTESWRKIDDCHDISSYGRVRSWVNRRTRLAHPSIMSVKTKSDGYQWLTLHKKTTFIHRLVLEAFTGPCPANCESRHLDGNPKNNKISNLAWGTKQENYADRVRHGTSNSGQGNGRSKLTDVQISEIRELYGTGQFRQKDLAKAFQISQMQVSNIVRQVHWK